MSKVKGGIAAGLQLGNLGFKVKGVSAQQIIDDSEYFAEILVRNKVVGFIGANPTMEQHQEILSVLYRGENTSLTPGFLEDQCHAQNDRVSTTNVDDFILSQWHLDNPFAEEVPSFTSLHMHTFKCSPKVGQTHFLSLTNLYLDCPEIWKDKLKNARLIPATGAPNEMMGSIPSHSALRTHPVTGETMLYWSGMDTRLEGGSEPWFEDLTMWVHSQMGDSSKRYTWEWSEGDLIIWDNRAVMHSFSPGWTHDQRRFHRGEIGKEKPYFDKDKTFAINEYFGDIYRKNSINPDESRGPNPDHIPLVFTKGIYALPGLEKYYQTTTMFVYSDNGELPEEVQRFETLVNKDNFTAIAIIPDSEQDVFKRYRLPGVELIGQKFIFVPNGDIDRAYAPDYDIFNEEFGEDGRWPPLLLCQHVTEIHPDMRHAGHAWHYPDWFPHQPLKYRPWDWRNLPFIEYIQLDEGQDPPEDFLVQYCVDTVFGCFNHLEKDEDRKRIVERVADYLNYMIELGEYAADR